MNEAQAYEAIVQLWSLAWTASQPLIPFALGNDAYPSQGVARFAAVGFGALTSSPFITSTRTATPGFSPWASPYASTWPHSRSE